MIVAALGAAISCAMIGVGIWAMTGHPPALTVPYPFPLLGQPQFALSSFNGFFMLVAGVVALPTSIYSAAYLRRYRGRYSLRWFAGAYALLLLSIAGVFAAADVLSFLIAWEVMTIASCALVAYEWRERENVRVAVLMLVMSEFGTLAAMLAFCLAARPAGALDFASIARAAASLPLGAREAIGFLSFFGFGVKAGILPFNAWLPRAHPEAPANISALLSAVILNLGVYGMLLLNLVLVPQNAMLFGILALSIGSMSAIVGILYAVIDDDLKRMLAFSSIENIGIVVAALGAGAIFLALRRLDLAALGFGAGLWHMANHSLYKSLLFLGAGAVDTKTGTRRINLLGGLARAMPVTALCFLVGALAIAAIPPLNGFGSEWLTLETLLRSAELGPLGVKVSFVLAGALLALTAALAVTCFVKAYAMTFLGRARSASACPSGDVSSAALAGMGMLAALCVLAGLFPAYVVQLVDLALPGALRGHLAQTLVPPFLARGGGGLPAAFLHGFAALGATLGVGAVPGRGLVLLHRGASANPVVFAMSSTYLAAFAAVILAGITLFVRAISVRYPRRAAAEWAGGLRPLLPEMTYTGTGFSNPVRVIFESIFHPRTIEDERKSVHDHFRIAITREREAVFVAERFGSEPPAIAVRFAARLVAYAHHGRLEGYVFYALGTLLVAIVALAL
jgi:hydrogenase-4 component B